MDSAKLRALERAADLVLGKEWNSWLPSYAVRSESKDVRRLIKRLYELDSIVAARAAEGEMKFAFLRPASATKK